MPFLKLFAYTGAGSLVGGHFFHLQVNELSHHMTRFGLFQRHKGTQTFNAGLNNVTMLLYLLNGSLENEAFADHGVLQFGVNH